MEETNVPISKKLPSIPPAPVPPPSLPVVPLQPLIPPKAPVAPKPPAPVTPPRPITPPKPVALPVAPPPKPPVPPLPPKPPVPAPPLTPAIPDKSVTIHTMQDDIEAPKPVAGAGTKPVAPAPSPLPPRKGAPPAKTITSPPVHRPRLPLSRLVILAGLAVVLIIGVGVVWYVGRSTGNSVRPASGATDALSVLPTQAQFVMRYSLGNDHDRQLLTTAWSRTGNKPSSATLVQGDPRALLALPDVKEFYYVILNNDPRSYLIVPVTDGTNKLFANNYDVVTAQ